MTREGSFSSDRPGAARVLAAAVVALTLVTFAGVTDLGFVFDDFHYLHLNPIVKGGLTASGLHAAFTSTHSANWHPLTWVSHMLDVQLFGLEPAGHHAVNLLFHVANAVLVLALLRLLTGALWRPALVAALFAVHPLRVESVAWVAERKDVLSAFLGLLCLLAYVRHARRPGPGGATLVALLLALGLLAKPMLVTLPFLMLLLDWWPLGRTGPRPAPRQLLPLVAEKAPLLILAGASSWATIYAQGTWGSLSLAPLTVRLANAATSFVRYLEKLLLPVDLVVPYPFQPGGPPIPEVLGAAAFLAAATWCALLLRLRRPYLLAGWLWYLGMLVPVIGIVQVGGQAMADRYTYLPLLGATVAAVWALGALAARGGARRSAVAGAALIALLALPVLTRLQLRSWTDEVSLFERALALTSNNWLAHNNLGVALQERGRFEQAKPHFEEAVRINPEFTEALLNLGSCLLAEKDYAGARQLYAEALDRDPDSVKAHADLGTILAAEGRLEEALSHFREALRLLPDSTELWMLYADALAGAGRTAEAESALRELVRLSPGDPAARLNHGVALALLGRSAEAEGSLREALRLRPDLPLAHRNLGTLLEARGEVAGAAAHYREAARLDPADADSRRRLAELSAPAR